MTYEALKIKAQQKADQTGKSTCIAEDYTGYKVYILTEKVFFSKAVQEIFEPRGKGLSPVAVLDACLHCQYVRGAHGIISTVCPDGGNLFAEVSA